MVKEPKLLCAVQQYELAIVRLTSMHGPCSATPLLRWLHGAAATRRLVPVVVVIAKPEAVKLKEESYQACLTYGILTGGGRQGGVRLWQ